MFRRSVCRRPRRYFRAVEIDGRVLVMKKRSKRRVKESSLRLIARSERSAVPLFQRVGGKDPSPAELAGATALVSYKVAANAAALLDESRGRPGSPAMRG